MVPWGPFKDDASDKNHTGKPEAGGGFFVSGEMEEEFEGDGYGDGSGWGSGKLNYTGE